MEQAQVGRPRSEKSREAVISTTHDLLNDKSGARLTIEAIAKRAKVGKPTIYRWWPTLADVVLEVLLRQADAEITVPAGEPLRETLRHFLRQSVRSIAGGSGAHLRFLMAQAQLDEEFRGRLRENFTTKRRAVLTSIFLQARERGEIGPDQNPDLLVDIVFGTLWYRLLVGHAALDESFADELTEVIIGRVQARPD